MTKLKTKKTQGAQNEGGFFRIRKLFAGVVSACVVVAIVGIGAGAYFFGVNSATSNALSAPANAQASNAQQGQGTSDGMAYDVQAVGGADMLKQLFQKFVKEGVIDQATADNMIEAMDKKLKGMSQ